MKVRCSNVTGCTNIVKFSMGFVQIGDRVFCCNDCALQWQQQERIIRHAAEGKPLYGRQPTREKPWYAKDG